MNTYLKFIADEKLLNALDILYATYVKSFSDKTLDELNKNIMDPFKFQFDTIFLNERNPINTLKNEIFRQSDKSISNAIGLFHQKILGSIDGFVETPTLPCDVKKCDDTMFVEVKNKHNTMNVRSAAGVYEELEGLAKSNPKAMCYLVEIISKKSSDEVWQQTINEKKMEHPRIHKISADKFYELATGDKDAFKQLCEALPAATSDFLLKNGLMGNFGNTGRLGAYQTLMEKADEDGTDILREMFKISFTSYNGFHD
ncbi:Eco47II family restriction endonuclease [Lachnospiraceae bacterium ZAX-1]